MGEGGGECVSQLIKILALRTAAILSETQKTAQTDDKKGINNTAIEKFSHYWNVAQFLFWYFFIYSFFFFFFLVRPKKGEKTGASS